SFLLGRNPVEPNAITEQPQRLARVSCSKNEGTFPGFTSQVRKPVRSTLTLPLPQRERAAFPSKLFTWAKSCRAERNYRTTRRLARGSCSKNETKFPGKTPPPQGTG